VTVRADAGADLSGASTDEGFVSPAYADRSLADVLPAVGKALGVEVGRAGADGPVPDLGLPPARHYVVLLVDGLGSQLLAAHADEAPFLAALLPGSVAATAGVPSTTATSLTSLGTGAPPGSHGVLGYTTRIPGTTALLNALRWSKEIDPTVWQAHPTAFARLTQAGVHTTVVNKREFEGSGLTVASCRGAAFVGVDRPGERLVAVRQAAARAPSLTYSYDGDLDWTGHRYGVASEQWRAQLTVTDAQAQRLRESLPDDVRLLVVADHGMVDVGPDDRTDVDAVPELQAGVELVAGEARFRHLSCHAGAVDDVVSAWREVLGERALVLARDDAVGYGWFGDVLPGIEARLGDVVVACRGSHAILSSAAFPFEGRLVGMHGSLTAVEMCIPVLVA
jgi:hypothetical protein